MESIFSRAKRYAVAFRLNRVLTNIFIICNIASVAWANLPQATKRSVFDVWPLFYTAGNYYGYATGLDSRWVMFASMPRARTWYTAEATFESNPTDKVVLPLKSEAFLDNYFFDFREPKFMLMLAGGKHNSWRVRYSKYLCRLPYADKITSISFISYRQALAPRTQAAATGVHLSPRIVARLIEELKC